MEIVAVLNLPLKLMADWILGVAVGYKVGASVEVCLVDKRQGSSDE